MSAEFKNPSGLATIAPAFLRILAGMKKLLLTTLALLAALGAQADTLAPGGVSLTGVIFQQGASKPTPISVKTLLEVFGYPLVSAASARIFYDGSEFSYVLASKDQSTIYGTIVAATSTQAAETAGSYEFAVDNITGLNGQLSGSVFGADYVGPRHHAPFPATFILSGQYNGQGTIIRGTILAASSP